RKLHTISKRDWSSDVCSSDLLPLTKEAYEHLIPKADGRIIVKKRYMIPLNSRLTLELDIFEKELAPLVLAEIEFPDEDTARSYRSEERRVGKERSTT